MPASTKYPSLDKADTLRIVDNLEDALLVFQHRKAPITVSEIQLKSMLIALKRELLEHAATLGEAGPRDQFGTGSGSV